MPNVIETTKPKNIEVKNQVPNILSLDTPISNNLWLDIPVSKNFYIEDSHGVLGTSNITYNEAGITYNDAGDIYGGGDILGGAIPHLLSIGIIDTTTQVVLQAGQPMGLLLTLTYPEAGTVG